MGHDEVIELKLTTSSNKYVCVFVKAKKFRVVVRKRLLKIDIGGESVAEDLKTD